MAFELSGITMLILNKDDIEFVTKSKCLLGHPVLPFINEKKVRNPLITL